MHEDFYYIGNRVLLGVTADHGGFGLFYGPWTRSKWDSTWQHGSCEPSPFPGRFRWVTIHRITTIGVPAWFSVSCAILGIAEPWTGRYLRFSLRTLLITTTLFALALGTVVWLAHR